MIRVVGAFLLSVSSGCSLQSESVTLSSGTPGGYYNRLGDNIRDSARATVGMEVRTLESEGSRQNLERLLEGSADFALVQLDVANEAMQQGKVQAVAILANEYVHIIARKEAFADNFAALEGQRVAVGTPGSGIRFTADRLLEADRVTVRKDASNFEEAFRKLRDRQIDAIVYVGGISASIKLKQQFVENPNLTLVPLQPELINHLSVLQPDSYRSATLPAGTYSARPPIPDREIPTLSTATVLVTRPDLDRQKVGLVTWSILSTARTYSQFYPELQNAEAEELLRKGLFYIHPAAEEVYEQGDPRAVLIRYWEDNSDLQAGVFILVTTSIAGLLLQRWRRRQSQKTAIATVSRINELKAWLPHNPQQALQGIETLSQEHRLRFIDGAITTEVYEQLQHKTQTFADECRSIVEQQRKKFVMDTLLLLDEWQATLQSDPEAALQKLGQIKQQYREMLLSDQVDIEAYIELMELTLMSLMTFSPTASDRETIASADRLKKL